MKRYLMLVLALLVLPSAAHAQTDGYLGLFTDEGRTSWCTSPATIPGAVTMYVMALPSEDSLTCVEFSLDYDPVGMTEGGVTLNPLNTVSLGNIGTGLSVCFACQGEWLFVCSQLLIIFDDVQYTVSIQPHQGTGGVYFSNCDDEAGRPKYDAIPFTNFYVNYEDGVDPECSETATDPASWGAIKSMYQ